MIKVLIAEDEILTRVGIVSAVDWQSMDMEVVAQASDGQQALQLFHLHRPQIVITDLNMPGLSGTQLIENIYNESPECRVIVVTCVNDVDTIRTLMPFRVFDYMLKSTISTEELTERLTLAKKQILTEGAGEEPAQNIKSPQKNLQEFLEGTLQEPCIFSGGYALLIYMQGRANNRGLLVKAVKDILEDFLRECGTVTTAVLQQKFFVSCFENAELNPEEILQYVQSFQEYAFKALNVHVLCSIEQCADANELRDISREYFNILSCSRIADWDAGLGLYTAYSLRAEKLLELHSFSIFSGEVNQTISQCFAGALQGSGVCDSLSFQDYKRVIIQGFKDLQAQLSLFTAKELEELCGEIAQAEYFEQVYLVYFGGLDAKLEFLLYPLSHSQEIRSALDYIQANFMDKISLSGVAEAAMLSPNYFSTIFKAGMDVSFINYMIRYRMYWAMKLLRDKNLYLYDIAEKVGIPELSHFSKNFKKVSGFSPNEWRKIMG